MGLFGLLGTGNIGNDASMEAVLAYLRADHPGAVIDAMCPGPERLTSAYGIDATQLHWHQRFERKAGQAGPRRGTAWRNAARQARGAGVLTLARKTLGIGVGMGMDAVRTASWVARHDLVIVPGMGALEATLPVRPWETPYRMFLMSASGRLLRTRVAFVSVGANLISQRTTRWLFDNAARLASYRSFRDEASKNAMRERRVDVSRDRVFPDLVFALPIPDAPPGDPQTVGIGVMAYSGGNDDREQADNIYAAYISKITSFVAWLTDTGRDVRLVVGDRGDNSAVQDIMTGLYASRPQLDPARVTAEPVSSFADLTRALAAVSIVVATRYHNVMCALKLGKPTISIGYAAKNEALMTAAGLGEFCQSASGLDVDLLIKQFTDLEGRAEMLRGGVMASNAENLELLDEQFALLSARLLRDRKRTPISNSPGTRP